MKRRTFLQSSALLVGTGFARHRTAEPRTADEIALAEHVIADVRHTEVQLKWPRFVGKNARRDIHGYGPKVTVAILTTDQGAKGWGAAGRRTDETVALLKGKRLSEVFQPDTGLTDERLRAFDVPLHDLAGVILNKPVYELLGRKTPITTKCYSGMIYFDELEPKAGPVGTLAKGTDRILENCASDHKLGYRQFKLKIGRGNMWMPKAEGLARDVAVTKLVRNAFPDCEILVDANDGYSVDDCIGYLKGVGDVPLFWVEEPFAETPERYRQLKAFLKADGRQTLLADGEYEPNQQLLRELENERLIDVCITDLMGLGFTPWRRLMPDLEKRGILASPHAFGEQFKSYYTAHLTGGLGNTVTIEGVPCTSDDVDFGDYRIAGGKLIPSAAPGFGMKLLKTT